MRFVKSSLHFQNKTNQVKSEFCHIPRTYRKPNSSSGDKARQNLLFAVFVATIPLLYR